MTAIESPLNLSALVSIAALTSISAGAQVPKPVVPHAGNATAPRTESAHPFQRAAVTPVRRVTEHGTRVEYETIRDEHLRVAEENGSHLGTVVVVGDSAGGKYPHLHAALKALIAANYTMNASGPNADSTASVRAALYELSQS